MKNAPKTFNHPAFDLCTLVPSLVAIKWATPLKSQAVRTLLSNVSLEAAAETAGKVKEADQAKSKHNPVAQTVNHSERLTWVTGSKSLDASIEKLSTDAAVEWIGPVYRAARAEEGEQSYFAINPTVLILTAEAYAAIGNVSTIDPSASIDEQRTKVLKGFVVVKLPAANAIKAASDLRESEALKGIVNGVKLENIPYLAPTCSCGCGSGTGAQAGKRRKNGRCTPGAAAHFPNDTHFPSQWGLQKINAPNAWPISKGSPNVVVAVLDQGVDLAHPDLNLYPISYSTITHTNDGSPVGNHGTTCAGIIGAKMDNVTGVSGLAGECPVMAIATNFADTEVAEGLFYAADNGARVVSMSFGVYPSWMIWDFSIIQAALQYCQEKNVVLVAASGNENQAVSRFPGSDPRTICVGGSNRDDMRKRIGDGSAESWWGACYGPDVDVVGPCLEIPTTDRLGADGYTPDDYDMTFNGTSSATPHVAALAGLVLSVNPGLSNTEVRQIISETTDKINTSGYVYSATAGKPYGTWNAEVGYGRINAERALLAACSFGSKCGGEGACEVVLPEAGECCVSPCEPPWLSDQQCLHYYEQKFTAVPLGRDVKENVAAVPVRTNYIEFRVTYEHRLCLLGKQHGPLLFTTTLLPGETLKLYHSDRYRRITSSQQRYSVQTTFMQFLSLVHEARVTNTMDALTEHLSGAKGGSSSGSAGGFFFGLFGGGGTSSSSSSFSVSDLSMLSSHFAAEQFNQSVHQASQLTHAERSVVVSTYEESETKDISVRLLHNANNCRAVTYFVRQVVELYAVSTRVAEISYRVITRNVPPEWHSTDDLDWLPAAVQNQIRQLLKLLPQPGQYTARPRPVSIPTDGVVYDPELAHCCSCEPERKASIHTQLEKQKAEALKACLEVKMLDLELQRRSMLLQKGQLEPFSITAGDGTVSPPTPPAGQGQA